jgi:3,4-dihydroxy 2-butanone 4-phosphate synthase/GTP cyclohydrolase II
MSDELERGLARFKAGDFVIVTDDSDRENEGDLFLLASAATTEKLAFMIRYTSGVICVALTEARSRELHLPLMVKQNQDTKRTAFTVTVDVKHGITTGISAEERANTIRALADSNSTAEDFIRPGHIFPLVANPGGLAARRGHTEAAIEVCRRVGAEEVGVICELVNEDGSMMRGASLIDFAQQHQIPIITIEELSKSPSPSSLASAAEFSWAKLPRNDGNWQIATRIGAGGVEHAVLRLGELSATPLLRVHSECLTGDVLGSLRCDCGEQLAESMSAISREGSGLIIYLRDHEGRGIGLSEKIRAYRLQDDGLDTVDANLALGHGVDERDFADAVAILGDLGISSVRLLTNNPAKVETLRSSGIATEVISLSANPNPHNIAYLAAKRERLGHRIEDRLES